MTNFLFLVEEIRDTDAASSGHHIIKRQEKSWKERKAGWERGSEGLVGGRLASCTAFCSYGTK